MVSGFIWDLELLSRKEDVNTVMHLPASGRLWSLVNAILCCVCSSRGECGRDHTLSHLSSPCSRSELLSQRMEIGWLTLDYIPECHIDQIYVSGADGADSSLPLIPEGLRYGQESGSELERFLLAQAVCSYLNCFTWVWGPTAISSPSSSLDAWLLCDRGRQLEKAVGCPGRL